MERGAQVTKREGKEGEHVSTYCCNHGKGGIRSAGYGKRVAGYEKGCRV